MTFSKQNIATFIAILFHVTGLIGILGTSYKEWFIRNTPFTLVLMGILLIWNQPKKNYYFFGYAATAFLIGFGTETIGVNTGHLFGNYEYGTVMGVKMNGVPLLIGLNWFVIVFCSASTMMQLQEWMSRKLETSGMEMSPKMANLSLIIDGALLATFFDWVMEPVAVKLGFWQWKNDEIPIYNYLCWFMISAFLLVFYRWCSFSKPNYFAVHLLIIQLLFFFALRIYL